MSAGPALVHPAAVQVPPGTLLGPSQDLPPSKLAAWARTRPRLRHTPVRDQGAPHAPGFSRALSLQIEGTQKLLNKDLAELINKMRLAQQNAVTSLSEECKRQMLTASHTLAVDAKNLLDAVDQAKVMANLAHPPAE